MARFQANCRTRTQKVRELVRECGFADATLISIFRIVRVVSCGTVLIRKYYLFTQSWDFIPVLPTRRGNSIRLRLITGNDLANGNESALLRFPRPKQELRARLSEGAECIIAELGEKVAGFLWFSASSFVDQETGIQFEIRPEGASAWDFDVFVAPEFRGTPVFYRLWSRLASELSGRGVAASTSLVWASNYESIYAHMRLGARALASGVHVRIAARGLMINFVLKGLPRARLYRKSQQAPRVAVQMPTTGFPRFRRFTRA